MNVMIDNEYTEDPEDPALSKNSAIQKIIYSQNSRINRKRRIKYKNKDIQKNTIKSDGMRLKSKTIFQRSLLG